MTKSWSIEGKVSIVIPCYNHGEMLREALASIERVRNANLAEVVIVNDGSTDSQTCKLFEELSSSEYVIFHQPNRGLGAARNAGVQRAKGEFILPLDSDNRLRKAYLTRGVETLRANLAVGVVYGDAEYFGEKTGRWEMREFDLARLAVVNYIDACALYRRSVWESVRGYDEKMPWMGWEDWDFWLRVAFQGWRFAHLNDITFDYRVRAGSMISETNLHRAELKSYIFNKAENRFFRLVRDQQMRMDTVVAELARIKGSKDYRLGRCIVDPVRRLKRLFQRQSAE